MDPILHLDDIHKVFHHGPTAVHVLRGVSLTVERARFVAVMGASGSGKSTLLHVAAGLEPPTRGRVLLEGQRLDALSDRRRSRLRRQKIGFVFQSYNLLPNLTVRENVALPLLIAGRPLARLQPTVDELLARVNLAHRADHRPEALSGGEQQRVAIARALLTRPALVLADEPTGNLDTGSRRQVYGLLRELVDRDGQTVLMVTHDPAGAALADQVFFLKDGAIVGQMIPEDHTHAQAVAACYQEFLEPHRPVDHHDPGGGV